MAKRETQGRRQLRRDEREALRLLIDGARRERIAWEAEARCGGCGVEMFDELRGEFRYVSGCRTCADRRAKHRRRGASALRQTPAQLQRT